MDETTKRENEEAQRLLEEDKKAALEFAAGNGVSFDKKPEEEKSPEDLEKDKKDEEAAAAAKAAEEKKDNPPEETPEEKTAREEKEKGDANEAAGLNRDGSQKEDKPEKYIPIDKYQDEKKAWKEEKKALEDQLASITKKEEGSAAREKMVGEFAEKYGKEPAEVEDLLKIFEASGTISPEVQEKIDEGHQAAVIQNEKAYFEKEVTAVLPSLKQKFPHASEEVIGKVKDLLWEVSHKEGFHDKDLDYVIFKHEKEIAALVPLPKEGVKGMETATPGQGKHQILTAKDFVGKSDFAALTGLPEDQVTSLVKSMDPETRLNYQRWQGEQQNEGVEVNRGGRVIRLK